MYEGLITEGSGSGLVVDPRLPQSTPPSAGTVVAWCLTIAAVLATASAACSVAAYSGIKVTSRIIQFSFVALFPVALVVAAVVALSITGADSDDRERSSGARSWAAGALAVCATAVLAASAYALAASVSDGGLGAGDFSSADWTSRVALTGVSVAGVVLGAVALYVIGCGRRATAAAAADDEPSVASDRRAIELPPRRRLDLVVACLIVVTVLLLAYAVTAAFSVNGGSVSIGGGFERGGASVASRIRSAAHSFNALPIAFAALAVVVLIAARGRRHPRDGISDASASVAAIVGLLAVGAAGYGLWEAFTEDVFFFRGWAAWWSRAAVIGAALASGILGAAAAYVTARGTVVAPVAPAVPEARRTRFDPTIVGLCVAIGALGSAVFMVSVFQNKGGQSIGDLVVVLGSYILTTVGLAFAAVIAVAFRRREPRGPTEPDARGNAVDVIAGSIALATLVASVFVIVYVGGHKDANHLPTSGFSATSLLDQSNTAQKVGYVLLALANGLIALGVLRLIWSSRRPPVDDEADQPGDQIPVVDLLP